MNAFHLPIGKYFEEAIFSVQHSAAYLTRPFANSLKLIFNEIVTVLISINPLLFILITTLAIYFLASRKIALLNATGLLLILGMDLWAASLETLVLVIISAFLTICFGVPLGILTALYQTLRRVIFPILDVMQTMPAYVYLIPVIPFFGLGAVTAIIATIIFSIPPVIRLTCLGIDQISEEYLEAADAFGSSTWQKLCKVQLPLARQTILGGINQGIMLSLSMVVLSALIGAKGLGSIVWRAIQRLDMGLGFEAGIAVVILAIILDRLTKEIAIRKAPHAS
jgi:glycine betaine/proline transport system permease protein